MLAAQTPTDTPEAHVGLAKTAAGEDYQNLFNFLCAAPARGAGEAVVERAGQERRVGKAAEARGGAGPAARRGPRGAPDRSTWYAEPVKVFDNLYFVGQTEYSVWAITTSEGIIVIDTIFDYSVEEEVDGGLKKLGLDPAKIKYAIVTHPHPDHHGGAKFLQDNTARRSSCPQRTGMCSSEQRHEAEARHGRHRRPETHTGDTTMTLYITPGHTPGTISA